mmetsp:Transcript_13874/g.43528  ORF Transcript_13874/g.43528 Transcript_13874/m.43528 type:complete len:211 (-) Transcript_13874:36-668(-)
MRMRRRRRRSVRSASARRRRRCWPRWSAAQSCAARCRPRPPLPRWRRRVTWWRRTRIGGHQHRRGRGSSSSLPRCLRRHRRRRGTTRCCTATRRMTTRRRLTRHRCSATRMHGSRGAWRAIRYLPTPPPQPARGLRTAWRRRQAWRMDPRERRQQRRHAWLQVIRHLRCGTVRRRWSLLRRVWSPGKAKLPKPPALCRSSWLRRAAPQAF